jgi:hypothetical protein
MDSFSIVGSSSLESQGDRFLETDLNRMVLEEIRMGTGSWSSQIVEDRIDTRSPEIRWDRTTIPDLFYCVLCKSVYFCREDILTHFCSGGQKESLRKRKNIERKEDCDLVEFLSWLLPRVVVYGKGFPKQVDDCLFSSLRETMLIGAPMDCHFGRFMMMLLYNTWNKGIEHQQKFIQQLFVSPSLEIDWEKLYSVIDWNQYPLCPKNYYHVPPTICIYNVNKKVKGDGKGRYANCYDDGYDKKAYRDLEDLGPFDLQYEVDGFSTIVAGDPYGDDVIKKVEGVVEILSGPKKKIYKEDALKILNSGHRFTVDEAGRFVKLFPLDSARRYLDGPTLVRYDYVKMIWSLYGPKDDAVCFDPDDRATHVHFDESCVREIFSIHNQFYYCGMPLWGRKVFELLSITIRDLGPNREFSSIYIKSGWSSGIPLIIYKLPEAKEVKIGEPLPLKGPFRILNPEADVVISFTTINTREASWKFIHDGHDYAIHANYPSYSDVVKTEICMDNRNTSMATIKYRLSSSAVSAQLAFTFLGELNQMITITDGYIVATDNGDVGIMRVVKEYNEGTPVCLSSGKRLPVDRYVFGVPTSCYLRVKVKLVYFVHTPPNEKRMIEGYHDFIIPECVSTQGLTVPASDGSTDRLCIECFWTGGD